MFYSHNESKLSAVSMLDVDDINKKTVEEMFVDFKRNTCGIKQDLQQHIMHIRLVKETAKDAAHPNQCHMHMPCSSTLSITSLQITSTV